MKWITIKNIIVSCFLFLQCAAVQAENYLLNQGDLLNISVWGDETLSKELRVLPDGSISFPLAGQVQVAGRTSTDVAASIATKLKKYLQDPEVTVIVTSTDGSRVYVLGKVITPGPIPLIGSLTVLQALSLAGGFDKFADLDSVKIIRNTREGDKVLHVDYSNLLDGKDLHKNYLLQADDTILVP